MKRGMTATASFSDLVAVAHISEVNQKQVTTVPKKCPDRRRIRTARQTIETKSVIHSQETLTLAMRGGFRKT